MSSSGSRRDLENMKHSRIEIYEDSQFTADEIEVADILILFCYSTKRLVPQWGTKRRRSTIQGKESSATHYSQRRPFVISASENDYELEHGAMALAPPSPPTQRLPRTSRLNSENVIAKNRPRKRAPKKKTYRELTQMMEEETLENSRLIKGVEQLTKTIQDLKDCHAQLALCLQKSQEQNNPCTSRPSSSYSDTRRETETATSCDDFQRCDVHENSSSSALVSAYDKSHRLGRAMFACSPESSFGFEKDGAMPTQDTVCSGFHDLNVSDESFFDTSHFK